jgi:glyoxylase I family protein
MRLLQDALPRSSDLFDPPADYPHYRKGYYAVFFADPDGLKLVFVHRPELDN